MYRTKIKLIVTTVLSELVGRLLTGTGSSFPAKMDATAKFRQPLTCMSATIRVRRCSPHSYIRWSKWVIDALRSWDGLQLR